MQHLHVRCGSDNDNDTDKEITEENTKPVAKSDKDVSTTEPLGDSALQRFA